MNIADAAAGRPPPPPPPAFPAFPAATGGAPLPPPPPPTGGGPAGGALRENDDIELESDMKKPTISVDKSKAKRKGGKGGKKGKGKESGGGPLKAIVPRIVLFIFFILYLASVGGWAFVLLCGLGMIGSLDDIIMNMGK